MVKHKHFLKHKPSPKADDHSEMSTITSCLWCSICPGVVVAMVSVPSVCQLFAFANCRGGDMSAC